MTSLQLALSAPAVVVGWVVTARAIFRLRDCINTLRERVAYLEGTERKDAP